MLYAGQNRGRSRPYPGNIGREAEEGIKSGWDTSPSQCTTQYSPREQFNILGCFWKVNETSGNQEEIHAVM